MNEDTVKKYKLDKNIDINEIVLNQFPISVLSEKTIKNYIIDLSTANNTQSFFNLPVPELLKSIGAANYCKSDDLLHPTLAGLLFFGKIKEIKQVLPSYNLFYGEQDTAGNKFYNRIRSEVNDDFSGNLYDFYCKVMKSIINDFKIPFVVEGLRRKVESPITPIIKGLVANSIVNAHFRMGEGLRIEKNITDRTIIIVTSKLDQSYVEDDTNYECCVPINKGLYKLFYLMDIGKKSNLGFNYFVNTLKSLNCELTHCGISGENNISNVLIEYSNYKFLDNKESDKDFENLSSKNNLTPFEKIVLAFIRDDVNISFNNLAKNCNKSSIFIDQIISSLIKKKEIAFSEEENTQWVLL